VDANFPAPVNAGPEAHPVPYTISTGCLPAEQSVRGVTLTTLPNLAQRLKEE